MSGPLFFDNDEEWLAWRGVGGTTIGAILGLSPWATPLQAYYELTGTAAPKPETLAMKVGQGVEKLVAHTWIASRGGPVLEVYSAGGWDHPDDGRLTATPDFLMGTATGDELIEVKVTGYLEPWQYGVPAHIEAQARWQLGMLAANGSPIRHCHVVRCAVPGWKLDHWTIEHDADWFASAVDAAQAFLAYHVDPRVPPAASLGDLPDLTTTAGVNASPLMLEGDQAAELEQLADAYVRHGAVIRAREKQRDDVKAQILQIVAGHTDVWTDANRKPLVTAHRQCRTNVATKGMPPWLLATIERYGHLTENSYPVLKVNA